MVVLCLHDFDQVPQSKTYVSLECHFIMQIRPLMNIANKINVLSYPQVIIKKLYHLKLQLIQYAFEISMYMLDFDTYRFFRFLHNHIRKTCNLVID
ncbi:hypothetical protein Lal_00017315 [Lupinus albus]|nr:hypothetical protein Lal_00017315 [Lupinus albus]